jgi:hypothetical protein
MRDKIGRGLMALAALGAIGAFFTGVSAMQVAGPERLWIEAWRTFGFLVFAGMFTLLAWRPRSSPGVWELVFVHKLAMVAFGFLVGPVAEAEFAGRVDLVLVVLLLTAWWLCRGWKSWSNAA